MSSPAENLSKQIRLTLPKPGNHIMLRMLHFVLTALETYTQQSTYSPTADTALKTQHVMCRYRQPDRGCQVALPNSSTEAQTLPPGQRMTQTADYIPSRYTRLLQVSNLNSHTPGGIVLRLLFVCLSGGMCLPACNEEHHAVALSSCYLSGNPAGTADGLLHSALPVCSCGQQQQHDEHASCSEHAPCSLNAEPV